MGMDARFTIWAGIRFDEGEDGEFREIAAAAPPGIFEPLEDPEDEYEVPELTFEAFLGKAPGAEGLELETINIGDETVGFGARIFYANWEDGAEELNLIDISGKGWEVASRMQALFAEWGLDIKVGIYGACDYS